MLVRPGFARLLGRISFAIALFVCAPAAAQGKRPRVEVVTAGMDADALKLEAVLRELLGHQPVTTAFERAREVDARDVVTPRPEAKPALARVWVDVSRSDRATVYMVDAPWERVLVRHVPLKDGLDEVGREQLGLIVSAGIDALLSGARIGLTREEAAQTLLGKGRVEGSAEETAASEAGAEDTGAERGTDAKTETASPPEDYRSRDIYDFRSGTIDAPPLDVGLAWEAQSWSSDRPFVHGPEAWLHTAFRRARTAPGLWLSGQYRLPVTVDQPPIGVRLLSAGVRLVGTLDHALGDRLALRGGAGLGIDLVNVEPRQLSTAEGEPASERSTIVPLARGLIALRYRLLKDTTLTGAFALDVEIADAKYVIERGNTKETVFDPWTLRPALMIGVATYLVPPP